MEQQKPTIRRYASALDFKTLLIIILGAFVVITLTFRIGMGGSAGMSKDELARITERYEQNIAAIEAENALLEEDIADYIEENAKLAEGIAEKKAEVEAMKALAEQRRRKIEELKREKEKNIEKFKNMDDEELVDWFDEYFKSKEE